MEVINLELWVLEWGPFKMRGNNFRIKLFPDVVCDNQEIFSRSLVEAEQKVHGLWMPIYAGTLVQCREVLSRFEKFEKMGF